MLNENHESGHPFVTFILFAYNQERYVREAIESAFAQDYHPLEIVLSDDCSTDCTYQIMQEAYDSYEGPHELRIVRNECNMGVTSHVIQRGREAKGEYIVVAAGDDISKPHRVSTIVPCFDDESVWGVTTGFDLIDDAGRVMNKNEVVPIGVARAKGKHNSYIVNVEHNVIQGSTAAYRKLMFGLSFPRGRLDFAEDNFFNVVIYSFGRRVSLINASLVYYREHDEAASNRKISNNRSLNDCLGERVRAEKNIRKMDSFLRVVEDSPNPGVIDIIGIEESLVKSKTVAMWSELRFSRRFGSILSSLGSPRKKSLRWKCLRVFGGCERYQPRSMLLNLLSLLGVK